MPATLDRISSRDTAITEEQIFSAVLIEVGNLDIEPEPVIVDSDRQYRATLCCRKGAAAVIQQDTVITGIREERRSRHNDIEVPVNIEIHRRNGKMVTIPVRLPFHFEYARAIVHQHVIATGPVLVDEFESDIHEDQIHIPVTIHVRCSVLARFILADRQPALSGVS